MPAFNSQPQASVAYIVNQPSTLPTPVATPTPQQQAPPQQSQFAPPPQRQPTPPPEPQPPAGKPRVSIIFPWSPSKR